MNKIILFFLYFMLLTTHSIAQEDISSLISPGDLAAPHSKYSGISNCTKCHSLGGGIPDKNCLECHEKLASRINNKQGLHSSYTEPCIKCHSDHKGKVYKMIHLDAKTFNHDATGYKLEDKHLKTTCGKCHKKERVYTGLSKDCITCHKDKHDGKLDKNCLLCHNFANWKNIDKFNHDRFSKYALEGKHKEVKCNACHPKGKFKIDKFVDCITCHKDIHKGKPVCKDCHTTEGWKKVNLDHSKTKYPLTNKHTLVKCDKCHINKRLNGISYQDCSSGTCHTDPHKKQFKQKKCEFCHSTLGWKPSTYSHNSKADAGYKLDGKHLNTACGKCHIKGRYVPLNYKSCNTSDCHKDSHNGQFKDKKCESCHTSKEWKPSLFIHNEQNYKGYKLDGKHLNTACGKCHIKGRYVPINYKTCNASDCHKDTHNGQFKDRKCESCHTAKEWKPSIFNHNEQNYKGYKLDGKHETTLCEKCHIKGRYVPLNYKTCNTSDCHKDTHNGQFKDKKCESCHTSKEWKPSLFIHNGQNYKGYKLDGKHETTACEKCHIKGRYVPINYKTCNTSDCHKDTHKDQFKDRKCESCHTSKEWKPSLFNHNEQTYKGYKLDGKHLTTACEKCHLQGRYVLLSYKTCNTSDCHKDTHNGQFKEKKCESCHTSKEWKPSLFEHNSSEYKGYKLDGVHFKTSCEKCHKEGKYTPISSDCITCHEKDDIHKNELGKICAKCHDTIDWKKFKFNHNQQTKFPLIGSHSNVVCEKCHKEKKYKTKAEKCIDCHEDVHKGKFKEECTKCHTQINWDPRKYDHRATTGFALNGVHNDIQCISCHKAKGDYKRVSKNCSQCHKDPHFNQFGSINCTQCHVESSWFPTRFNHINTGFPLIGKHRLAECGYCHKNGVYRNLAITCLNCHSVDYSSAPKHNVGGYSLKCTTCHSPSINSWSFTHASLSGNLDCSQCHLKDVSATHVTNNYGITCWNCHKSYSGWAFSHSPATTGCSTCHISKAPASHASNHYGTTCENCHKSTSNWSSAKHAPVTAGCSSCHITKRPITHSSNSTKYPTNCESCHKTTTAWIHTHPVASSGCSTCHMNDRVGTHTSNPTKYLTTCESCHKSTTIWTSTHTSTTTGCSTCHQSKVPVGHTTNNYGTTCENCHKFTSNWSSAVHAPVTTGCSSCHITKRPATHSSNSIKYSTNCESCHKTTTAWIYTHPVASSGCSTCHINDRPNTHTSNQTKYLTTCESCHKLTTIWSFTHPDTTTGCSTCHQSKAPTGHTTNNYGTTCENCHKSTTSWFSSHAPVTTGCSSCHIAKRPATHSSNSTKYPTNCESCHKSTAAWTHTHPVASSGCSTCHINDRPGTHTSNPIKYLITCESCHKSTTIWAFTHPTTTTGCSTCHTGNAPATHSSNSMKYPTNCENCHKTTTAWIFTHPVASSGCSTCHINDRPGTHTGNPTKYLTTCESCHRSTTIWTFTHPVTTTGCSTCHISNVPAGHTSNNYGTTCENCHKSISIWSSVVHGPVTSGCSTCHISKRSSSHISNSTKYPTTCENCHKSTTAWIHIHPVTSSGCSTCHINDRPTTHTGNPAKYLTTCESCHKSTTIWTFTHPASTTGCSTCHLSKAPAAHTSKNYGTTCENCHKSTASWSFTHSGLITGCSACHSTDVPTAHNTYSNRFGSTCQTCHKYPAWAPATFSHTFSSFPTTHKGSSVCSDCHVSQNYGNKGGCIECHNARRAEVHNTNQNSACLSCHPTGR